jgi:carboxyl-terminal processing protease
MNRSTAGLALWLVTALGVAPFPSIDGGASVVAQAAPKATVDLEVLVGDVFELIWDNAIEEMAARPLVEAAIRGMAAAAKIQASLIETDVLRQLLNDLDGPNGNGDPVSVVRSAYRRVRELSAEDPATIYAGALRAMVRGADPQGSVQSPRETPTLASIGVQLKVRPEAVIVASVISDGPAQRAGMCPMDTITSIAGESVAGRSTAELAAALSGDDGTRVNVIMGRGGSDALTSLDIVRETPRNLPMPFAIVVKNDVGYIKLPTFDGNTDADVTRMLRELRAQGVRALVLDLRDNSGGPLDQAVKLTSRFVSRRDLIVYTRGRGVMSDQDFRRVDAETLDLPVVILVNLGTSSGAEIVAAALQESGRARVVGVSTFGETSVKSVFRVADGSRVVFTTAEWFTPKGRLLKGTGLVPDLLVHPQMNDRCDRPLTPEDDKQLQAAVGMLGPR